jgi:hypothetical protein
MPAPVSKSFLALGPALALATAAGMLPEPARADSPVPSLVGAWSGNGKIRLEGGKSEAIKCKAYYTAKAGGAGLSLAIRCASASSSKIEMRATIDFNGSKASGNWEERTYNATGDVAGSAGDGKMSLAISGPVQGQMNVSYGGATHQVSITTTGSALQGVNISLSRG